MFLSILWHFHQPIYRLPNSNKFILPYVDFHLTKNYYQMAYLAEEQAFPCNFNLVPCLLEQIETYTHNEADDRLETMLKKSPDDLTFEELSWLGRVLPYDGSVNNKLEVQLKIIRSFFSPLWEAEINKIKDKDHLLEKKKELQKEVIPLYKRLYLNNQIELTTSAYYHPLLPLIVDLQVDEEARKKGLSFRYPEDAAVQIDKGRRYFRQLFDLDPVGFWPSEGGVSDEVIEIISKYNFAYLVTDEHILWKTLQRPRDFSLLTRPYLAHNLIIFFRDRELSDLISFEYQHWDTDAAINHFMGKIKERMDQVDETSLLVIALDGENPWAGYPDNGVSFLRKLYSRLKATAGLHPIRIVDYLRIKPAPQEIKVVPGTWMGDFSRWVGHPAKNAAWEKLAKTRDETGQNEAILIAEGSDWFWWFGEPCPAEFEILFNSYLDQARKGPSLGLSNV